MKNKKKCEDADPPKKETSLVKARDLTPTEQQRIQKLKQARGNEEQRYELFTTVELENGKQGLSNNSNPKLAPRDAQDDRDARLLEVTGCSDQHAATTLLATFACPFFEKRELAKSQSLNLNSIASLMAEFKPRDAIEGSLCGQIVACQQKGLEMLASASNNKESVAWANSRGNAASKLLARSQNALQMLINYRRGKEQKIIVEHINIESGGKAAFGSFNNGGGGDENKNTGGTP